MGGDPCRGVGHVDDPAGASAGPTTPYPGRKSSGGADHDDQVGLGEGELMRARVTKSE